MVIRKEFYELRFFKFCCSDSNIFKTCFYCINTTRKSFFHISKITNLAFYFCNIIFIVNRSPKIFKDAKNTSIFYALIFIHIKRNDDIEFFFHDLCYFNELFEVFYIFIGLILQERIFLIYGFIFEFSKIPIYIEFTRSHKNLNRKIKRIEKALKTHNNRILFLRTFEKKIYRRTAENRARWWILHNNNIFPNLWEGKMSLRTRIRSFRFLVFYWHILYFFEFFLKSFNTIYFLLHINILLFFIGAMRQPSDINRLKRIRSRLPKTLFWKYIEPHERKDKRDKGHFMNFKYCNRDKNSSNGECE